jgi:uncharacterized protein YbbC (DUF1343 family)
LPEIGFCQTGKEKTFEAKEWMMQKWFFIMTCLLAVTLSTAQPAGKQKAPIVPGAERLELYLPLLKGKTVAVFANQTSMVGSTHLVDTLVKRGIQVKKIFSPEHGFRGDADAGEQVESTTDPITGLTVISLYGKRNRATADDLKDVDVLLFDLQDVGARFYTYINDLQRLLESAIENDKPLLVLDRPNPNGFYVDGPTLQKGFNSGIGVQPVPVVYGMTEGEYAKMLLGEKMLADKVNEALRSKEKTTAKTAVAGKDDLPSPGTLSSKFELRVIPCKNYDHTMTYVLPVRPSPNLPTHQSVLLYPSICFFEGTDVSLGRGTDKPFQIFGAPSLPDTLPYTFTPASVTGAKNPPLLGKLCHGYDLSKIPIDITKKENRQINLSYLLKAYRMFPQKDSFFLRPKKGNPATSDYFFNKLAGNDLLMWQILNGKSEADIRKSWAPAIALFKKVRKKYLLYRDFE